MRLLDRLDNFSEPRDLKCNFIGTAIALGIAAAASIGGSVVNGVMTNKAANTAASAQERAAQLQVDENKRQYDLNRADQKPWMDAGGKAINQLSELTGPNGDLLKRFSQSDFQADPGYQFRLQEGQKALERSAAARGSVLGGAQLKALDQYNQNFASNEYTNAYNRFNTDQTNEYNRLAGISGAGQVSANTLGNQGTNLALSSGNALYNGTAGAGATRASGYIGVGNAINSGLSGIQNLLFQKYQSGGGYPVGSIIPGVGQIYG